MTYLKATSYIDYESKSIQDLVKAYKTLSDKEKAISLYEKVRDDWRYDPYTISLEASNYKASHIAKRSSGNCVEKSVLLVAVYRAVGLPARLHLGKVKNHIAVERLTEKFGSNELTPHGMVNVRLNDKWLKLSPAFNKELCKKFNVDVLDFDGVSDSFLQAYNSEGNQFMEYTADYGFFEDVPLEFMKQNIKEHYPHIFDIDESIKEFKL
ncbi:transglutaminase family protein [Winogradskyella sp. SYSU M77433]|uniref:transglutaminase-like domain-containing protein n=1 Tax=Winogradskyella sp. SYSU M77433 TaxID=3042722 RepID=UPI00247FC609|nr:transglutaminase family protein [Winogradskyella sp. SYSU M77433]MDH7911227.1 transglutaminase family protein [Winogradskyella sp. SYSU M77433]